MTGSVREAKLSKAFVQLADTLVADFDLVEMLQTLVETCADVLDVRAAGLLLKDESGKLHLVVSTTEDAEFVELVQLGADSGPCLECVASGEAVDVPDIAAAADRWPAFSRAALDRGFRSLQATPLRLRHDVIGTMNLLDTDVGALNEQDVAAAQALSDVATIGILTERAARQRDAIATQLQNALDSRVLIEQAKGILAQSTGRSTDEAFTLLRTFARSNNLNIRVLAGALVERRIDPSRVEPGRGVTSTGLEAGPADRGQGS